MRLDIPTYDVAFMEFGNTVIRGFVNLDPLLGQIGHKTISHTGPIRNVRGENPLDQDMPPIEAQTLISMDAIKNTDLDEIVNFFYALAEDMRGALAKQFFVSISEVTSATGQVFDAKGEPLSLNHINETLAKMPIEFDENGEPIMPTLVISPEMIERLSKLKETPEQQQQFRELINKKRMDFYAKQRTRRLS